MNIALCFSGHLRNFAEIYSEFIDKLIIPLQSLGNVYTFFSIWNTLSTLDAWRPYTSSFVWGKENEPINTDFIIKNFSPSIIEIEHFEILVPIFQLKNFTNKKNTIDKIEKRGFLVSTPQFYKMHKVNELRKTFSKTTGINFDIVFRLRPDFPNKQVFDIGLLNVLDSVSLEQFNHDMASDYYAFGNSSIMDKYFFIFNNLTKILSIHNTDFGAERLLRTHFRDRQIPARIVTF